MKGLRFKICYLIPSFINLQFTKTNAYLSKYNVKRYLYYDLPTVFLPKCNKYKNRQKLNKHFVLQ